MVAYDKDPTKTWVFLRKPRELPLSYRGKLIFMCQRIGLTPLC